MNKPAFNHSRLAALILVTVLASPFAISGKARGSTDSQPKVTIMRTPEGGTQPQAVVDRRGVLHLIYLRGDPDSADIHYVKRAPSDADFSAPIRVNSADKAIATGTVRGPQLAIGRNGLVHVAWMGAHPERSNRVTPVLYTRLNDAGTMFEPERNVMEFASGLDGGASVAADNAGNVYVVWHANPAANGEAHRRVFMARSNDDGRTFSREVAVDPQIGNESIGACGCCGMRALTDSQGTLYIFYRAATDGIHRDDPAHFTRPWRTLRCGPGCEMGTERLPHEHGLQLRNETVRCMKTKNAFVEAVRFMKINRLFLSSVMLLINKVVIHRSEPLFLPIIS